MPLKKSYPPMNAQQQSLATENMPLAYWVIGRYFSAVPRTIREDAELEAIWALCEAAQRYDPDYRVRGQPVRFSTFATWWVWGRVKAFLARHSSIPARQWEDSMDFALSCRETAPIAEQEDQLTPLLARLSRRERIAIDLRYGHDATFAVIGQALRITRERSRQITRDALERMRRHHA